MTEKIKNKDELMSCGERESRQIVLDIAERVLERLDGYRRVKELVSLSEDTLRVGDRTWDLSKKRNVYLVGAGKACNAMAMAVDEILGNRLTKGICIVKIKESSDVYQNTEIITGGHPLPNEEGVKGCLKILELIERSGPGDLFISVMSGGSTALMCCPVEGITLEEERAAADIMLKSGADVNAINAVRRHISRMNGGRMAQRIKERGAELIGIDIYDAAGMEATGDILKPRDFHGTPMGPDNTTLEDARAMIRDYALEDRLPESIVRFLNECGPEGETPKEFPEFTYFVINTVPDSCIYGKEAAESMGLAAHILTTTIEGESSEAGVMMASIAREIQRTGNPVKAPCVLLSSGETTTKILDEETVKGHGGPSQELVTGFATAASDIPGACMYSMDTEGTDVTTDAAGGITDSTTYRSAGEAGVDLRQALREHATNEALSRLGSVVMTGNTGTNLCDLNILYVPAL